MNLCKVIHAQSKSTKAAWPYSNGEGGCCKFITNKKCSADAKYLRNLVASAMDKSIKFKKKYKANTNKDSELDE